MDKSEVSTNLHSKNHISIQGALYKTVWQFLDWVYPPACAGCGKQGYRFCPACESTLHILEGRLCTLCGQPNQNPSNPLCSSCLENPPEFDCLRSLAIYQDAVREALLKMKFHQDFGISEYFGRRLVQLLNSLQWKFDLIIPVPLNPQREKMRGFNQSYRLAIPIALAFSKPICTHGIIRVQNTLTQADLPREKRRRNVHHAFLAHQELVEGKTILLVDDIATTSSTMHACSQALREKHAKTILGITAARAIL